MKTPVTSRAISVGAACAAQSDAAHIASYGLSRNPFLTTPDPHLLFLTPEHQDALTGLISTVVQRRGIGVLTGNAGTGKTTILRTILEAVPDSAAHFGVIIHPTLSAPEFLEMLLLDFGISDPPPSKARRLFELQQMMLRLNLRNRLVVLVVDEAHRLLPEVLEEIRLLANFECATGKLLQIVLSGQDELDRILDQRSLRQVKQRIAFRAALRPLSVEYIRQYLSYRWTQCGGNGRFPFGEECIAPLAHYSGGIPRIINAICDKALVAAWSTQADVISPEHIAAAAGALGWKPDRHAKGAGSQ